MSAQMTALKVFIASPGNLAEERAMFLEVLQKYNFEEAHEAKLSFLPRGLEFAFAGVGRPQELINEQIRESDYAIVMFWDKWGQPTSPDGAYSSGTEEEFHVAMQCLGDANSPMRDVIVLFKGVGDRQMSDPGKELTKVLEFKKKLEIDRAALYANFDSTEEFRSELQRHLSKWTRAWREGDAPPKASPTRYRQAAPAVGSIDEDTDALSQALALARQGRNTEAEQLFATATTAGYVREAHAEYARFLRKLGRYGAAETVSSEQVELARDSGDIEGQIDGLANLGIIKRLRGQKEASEAHLRQALRLVDAQIADGGEQEAFVNSKAFLLDNLSLTLRRSPYKLEEARGLLQEAWGLRNQSGDVRGEAHTLRTLGVLETQIGDYAAAKRSLEASYDRFDEEDYDRGRAVALSSLGEVLEQMDQLGDAESKFEQALAINVNSGNRQGRSMNLSQLSRVRLAKGQLPDARHDAEACIELNEQVGSAEGLASGLHALGRVLAAEGNTEAADSYLLQAYESFSNLQQPIGIAATLIDLARLEAERSRISDARELLVQAHEILNQTPHAGLTLALKGVETKLPSLNGAD